MGTIILQGDHIESPVEANNKGNVDDNIRLSPKEYFNLPSFFIREGTEILYLTLPKDRLAFAQFVNEMLMIKNMTVPQLFALVGGPDY